MRRMRPWLTCAIGIVWAGAPVFAAEPVARRDVFYTAANDKLQSLDVYAPAQGNDLPVIVWIHGGGWKEGDKAGSGVQKKPQAFADRGFVFVSVNYRLLPAVALDDMMGDVAKSIRWVRDHAREHRGNPDAIVVMGHSAGAHLAALVCTDDRYLQAEGVPFRALKACVPIDVSAYDIPKRIRDVDDGISANFRKVFGEEEQRQRAFSPITYVRSNAGIPPFLILHVASRADTKAQAQWLADALAKAGVAAGVIAAEGKTHGTIGSDLGKDGDAPTQELWKFLDEACGR